MKDRVGLGSDLSGVVVACEDVLLVRAAWHKQRTDHHGHDRNHDGIPEAGVDVAGLRGNGIAPSYNASKAYQINYLEGLRQKASKLKSSILITDVRPGFVDTAMAKGEGQFWVSSVEKASKQIFNSIQKKKKVVYVTKRWRFIALLLKSIPRIVYDRL